MKTFASLCAALLWLSAAGIAHAQSLRTWVSGVGDDANSCDRTAPCATFNAALAVTASGGEVDALDPGDFGPVTINGSITLDGSANGTLGGVGVSGITVNAGPNDRVLIRGLSILGDGTTSGVVFASGGTLQLEDSYVAGFTDGIVFLPPMGGQLLLRNVVTKDNSGAGLVVGSSGATSWATVTDSRSEGNDVGVRAVAGGRIGIYDSDASHNVTSGISAAVDAGGGRAEINLESVVVNGNSVGVRSTAVAGTAVVRMSNVLASGNTTGPVASTGGGALFSFGNNRFNLVPALALTSTNTMQTVTAGSAASYALDVAFSGPSSAPITFACAGLPPGASCQLTPANLPGGTRSGSALLTVTTTSVAQAMGGFLSPGESSWPTPKAPPVWLFGALALALAMAFAKRRTLRRPLGAAIGVLLLGGVLTIAACGSSSSTTAGADLAGPGTGDTSDLGGGTSDLGDADLAIPLVPTPAGTYAVTVTATAGGLTSDLPLTLIVN
jgi:hypothetical protein